MGVGRGLWAGGGARGQPAAACSSPRKESVQRHVLRLLLHLHHRVAPSKLEALQKALEPTGQVRPPHLPAPTGCAACAGPTLRVRVSPCWPARVCVCVCVCVRARACARAHAHTHTRALGLPRRVERQ